MFLLVTAVWNRLASVEVSQQVPSPNAPDVEQAPEISLYLQVTHEGYAIASSAGDRIEIPRAGDAYDQDTLRTRLAERHEQEPNRHDIIVSPEDGVQYADVIAGMDLAIGAGFSEVSVSDGAAL